MPRIPGDGHRDGLRRQGPARPLAPLHGAHAAAIQVVVPADVKEVLRPLQAVEVKMEQGQPSALVLVDDGKGGTGDPLPAFQAPGQAPGKGGLPHA